MEATGGRERSSCLVLYFQPGINQRLQCRCIKTDADDAKTSKDVFGAALLCFVKLPKN